MTVYNNDWYRDNLPKVRPSANDALIAAVPLPPLPEGDGRPLPVAPGEMWCRNCGASVAAPSTIKDERGGPCCGRPKLVPVERVLATGEYYVLN